MMNNKLKNILLTVGVLITSTHVANASTIELINNGGFETGDFSGWTTTDLVGSTGQWYVDDNDLLTPESSSATVGASSGNFYAVTDQNGAGTHALSQAFIVPVGATSTIISFDMFMNNHAGVTIVDPIGLDHTSVANQHARVDIITASSSLFSVALADVVVNLVAPGADAGTIPNPYTAYSIDVSGMLTAGTQYVLRFAETDNQLFFNQGVDNVSVISTITTSVPEASTIALFVIALAGMRLRRKML